MLWPVACRGRKVIKGEAEGLDRVRQGRQGMSSGIPNSEYEYNHVENSLMFMYE